MSNIETLTENEVLKDVLGMSAPGAGMAAGAVALRVVYEGAGAVECGCDMRPSATKEPPRVYATGLRAGAKYTLIMSDPDAPSRAAPRCREWLHWIVANTEKRCGGKGMEGEEGEEGEEETEVSGQGYTVCDYNGPTPPRGTGKHRYVFVLYEQLKGDIPEAVSDK